MKGQTDCLTKQSWHESPWLRFVVGLALTAGGQWIINLQEPLPIVFTFFKQLERRLHLGIRYLDQAVLGFIVLVAGGVLFARVSETLCIGPPDETPTGTSTPASARKPTIVMVALPAVSILLSVLVVWRVGSDRYSDSLLWFWGISVALMALFWLGWDRRHAIRPRIKLAWSEVAFLATLLLIGLLIAAHRLSDIPDVLMGDEGSFWELSSSIARGDYHPNLFGFGTYTYPVLGNVYQSIFPRFFGFSLWSWRIGSVVAGLLVVIPLYLLLREAFDARIGKTATVVMIVSPYFLAFARLGYNNSQAIFPVVLSLLFLYVAMRQMSRLFLYLAGAFAGFGFYTYTAGRLAAAVTVLYLVYLVREREIDWRSGLAFGAVFFLGLALVIGPHIVFGTVCSPEDMSHKMLESAFFNAFYGRSVFSDSESFKNAPVITVGGQELFSDPALHAKLLARGLLLNMIAFNYEGLITEHFITSSLAGPLATVFFVLGLFLALKRIRQPASGLILIWFFAAVLLLSVLNTFPPRDAHLVPAIPAMAGLVALGIDAVSRFSAEHSRRDWLRDALALVIVGTVAFLGVREYFVVMPDRYRPNMENILFWTANEASVPGNLVYIYDGSEPDGFVPWGIRHFDTPLQYVGMNREQFLQASDQFRGRPTVFVFPPEGSDALVRVLEEQYGGQGILRRYSDPGGQPIAVAYATDGLIPHRHQPQAPIVDPQTIRLALALALLFAACIALLKGASRVAQIRWPKCRPN